MTIEGIIERNPEQSFLKADGFDEAIIGYERESFRLIYSIGAIIVILQSQGMEEEEAIEHFEYNIGDAYLGEQTPIYSYP